MTNPTLVIGDKSFSSWSLRPWLLLKQAGIPFKEILVRLYQPTTKAEILSHSPNGKVPCLIDGDTKIWESMAICEYIAESHPNLWPENKKDRAHARAISNEMHAGFATLRQNMSMKIKEENLKATWNEAVDHDIRRILQIWTECREKYRGAGPFLFGQFSVADAMYAPVVSRFRTYGVDVTGIARAYAQTMWDLPAMQEWLAGAKDER